MPRARRGRGEGGIFQRADGLWVCSLSLGYDANGKRKRRTVYGKTKKKVQDKMDKLRNSPDQPKELAKLTVETYLSKWLELIKPTVEYGTFKPYRSHVKIHIVPHLGTIRLTELKRFHIEEWYATLTANEVSPAMQKKIGSTLTIALGAAADKEMIASNPASRVKKPKAVKPEIVPLAADQVSVFLDAARADRLYSFYVVALDSGARPGELFALEWPDVDFERSWFTITKSLSINEQGERYVKTVKTKRARRTIELSQTTMEALAEHRKRMLREGHAAKPVFCSPAGVYLWLSSVHRLSFKPILKRAKLPNVRLYDLRHTCATLLLQDGENIKVVSERLGHASVSMTLDIYCHVMKGMQEQAATRMNGILSRKPRKAVND